MTLYIYIYIYVLMNVPINEAAGGATQVRT